MTIRLRNFRIRCTAYCICAKPKRF